YSMCVEPDGAVLPCQSFYQPLGNLLADSWDSIWNHELSVRLRERGGLPEKCTGCSLVPECGGGCPLQFPAEANTSVTLPIQSNLLSGR
ncbi:MAG: SPASM domain-containing protein, partial [Anaerolineales bacterium]